MYYKITPEQLEQILNELVQKPWVMVNNTINKLLNLEKVEDKPLDNK